MTNHARTLLINLPDAVAGIASGLPHACYIAPGFIPATRQEVLRYRQLFGPLTLGDAATRLRTFAALVPVLHGPGLEKWTLQYDSRVTYLGSGQLVNAHGTVSALLERLAAVDMSSQLIELQYETARHDSALAVLLRASDAIIRAGAALLAYVAMHERSRLS